MYSDWTCRDAFNRSVDVFGYIHIYVHTYTFIHQYTFIHTSTCIKKEEKKKYVINTLTYFY